MFEYSVLDRRSRVTQCAEGFNVWERLVKLSVLACDETCHKRKQKLKSNYLTQAKGPCMCFKASKSTVYGTYIYKKLLKAGKSKVCAKPVKAVAEPLLRSEMKSDA